MLFFDPAPRRVVEGDPSTSPPRSTQLLSMAPRRHHSLTPRRGSSARSESSALCVTTDAPRSLRPIAPPTLRTPSLRRTAMPTARVDHARRVACRASRCTSAQNVPCLSGERPSARGSRSDVVGRRSGPAHTVGIIEEVFFIFLFVGWGGGSLVTITRSLRTEDLFQMGGQVSLRKR